MELWKIIILNTEYLNFIGVQLTYNAVLVSSIHQSESYLYNFIYISHIYPYICLYIYKICHCCVCGRGWQLQL